MNPIPGPYHDLFCQPSIDTENIETRRVINENAMTPDQFRINLYLSPENDEEYLVKWDEAQKLERKFFSELLLENPSLLYRKLAHSILPLQEIVDLREKVLDRLLIDIQSEIDSLDIAKECSEETAELHGKLLAQKELIASSKVRNEKDKVDWVTKRKEFYQFVTLKPAVSYEEFHTRFLELRQSKPDSLMPFFPYFLYLSCINDDKELTLFLRTARRVDPYMTYAFNRFLIECARNESDPKYDTSRIVKILSSVYPEDLVLSYENSQKKTPLNLRPIADSLSIALGLLAHGDTVAATALLAEGVPSLIGYAHLHRYLAITWAVRGYPKLAADIYLRSSRLPALSGPYDTDYLAKTYAEMLRQAYKVTTVVDALKLFILLVNQKKNSPNCTSTTAMTKLIDQLIREVSNNLENIDVIYFIARWLRTQPEIENYFQTILPLTCILAKICYKFKPDDPWLNGVFIKREDSGIDLRPGFYELDSEGEEIPTFHFDEGLQLMQESIIALSFATLKILYEIPSGFFVSRMMKGALDRRDPPLFPSNAIGFQNLLSRGLKASADSSFFTYAEQYLTKYLSLFRKKRPFMAERALLDWAIFSLFSKKQVLVPHGRVEKEIIKKYYPKVSESRRAIFWKLWKEISPKRKTNAALMVRDLQLAFHSIEERSLQESSCVREDVETVYSLFVEAQKVLGWRLNESFESWGDRLRLTQKNEGGKEEAEIEISALPTKNERWLRLVRAFWIHFHTRITEKNRSIHEENEIFRKPQKNSAAAEWKSEKEWHTEKVKQHKEHYREINRILSRQSKNCESGKLTPLLHAALLITKYEEGKEKHNIFVEKKDSELIYRLLLEHCILRIVRESIVQAGPDHWQVREEKWFKEKILDVLTEKLQVKFRGPEMHLAGKGSLEPHYHALVINSNGVPSTTHIFFT